MNSQKRKFQALVALAIVAIVGVGVAHISDFIEGIILGAGITILVYSLYKWVTIPSGEAKEEQ